MKEKHCVACLHPGLINFVIFFHCLPLPSHKQELAKHEPLGMKKIYFSQSRHVQHAILSCTLYTYIAIMDFFPFLNSTIGAHSLLLDVLWLVTLPFVAMEIDARGCRASESVLGKSLNGT